MLFRFTKSIFTILILFLNFGNLHSQVFFNEVESGVTVTLRSVSNVNSYIAWVCGASGTVIRTTNGGYNWTNHTGNGIPVNVLLINIYGIDASTAITAGYTGTNTFVYRTSNGGANWSQVFTETNGFINAVWMRNSSSGFMEGDPVGGRWSLWKTTNGGINWDSAGLYLPQAGSEAGWNNSLWIDSNKIWFGTNNTRIYHSTNYGNSWNVQSTSPEMNTYSMSFDDTAAVFGLTGGAALLRTTNSGTNWLSVTTTGTGNFNGLIVSTAFFNFSVVYQEQQYNLPFIFPLHNMELCVHRTLRNI